MARLNGPLKITGSLGNLSFYNMIGVEHTIVREKGGATKEDIEKKPQFEMTRLQNKEFRGRATGSKFVMWALDQHKTVANFNFAGPINALLKHIQDLDPVNNKGERSILLTHYPRLLEGFEFNRTHSFSAFVRHPLQSSVDTSTLTATIDIPELIPGINFIPQFELPYFRLLATLRLVPDVVYKESIARYDHINDEWPEWKSAETQTEWYPISGGAPAIQLTLKSESTTIPEPSFIAVLAISLQFGKPGPLGSINSVKYVGGGKILAVGSVALPVGSSQSAVGSQ